MVMDIQNDTTRSISHKGKVQKKFPEKLFFRNLGCKILTPSSWNNCKKHAWLHSRI